MRGGSSFSEWANPGATPRGQLRSKPHPESHPDRCERNIVRPLPRMQVNNEERRRGEQNGLCAEQPAIGPPVKRARALIELLRVAPDVAAGSSQRARGLV